MSWAWATSLISVIFKNVYVLIGVQIFLDFDIFAYVVNQQAIYAYLECAAQYNLNDRTLHEKYLPRRCNNLIRKIMRVGISGAIDYVLNDADIDSSLIIIDPTEPYRVLAYSRRPELAQLNARELQKNFLYGQAERMFRQLISTAHKGVDYIAYEARLSQQLYDLNVAFVREVVSKKHTYVVGVTINIDHVDEAFILPYRVNSILKRIKKDCLEPVLSLINHDIDHDNYFIISEATTPFRWIAHGVNDKIILQDMHAGSRTLMPVALFGMRSGEDIIRRLIAVAQRGGGFNAYVWKPAEDEPTTFRIVYVAPFEYCKNLYVLTGVYVPLKFPVNLAQKLFDTYNRTRILIDDVGVENAAVVLRKERTKQFYSFIREMQFPYRAIVSGIPSLDRTIGFEAQKLFADKKERFDVLKTIKDIVWFAREFGGFHAFLWPNTSGKSIKLSVAYVGRINSGGKEYYVGAAYTPS